MAEYVDGYVIPIPKKNIRAYKKMAQEGSKVWKRFGALQYFECVGDDLNPKMPGMKMVGFSRMAKAGPKEVVFFSFIIYKSRKHRDSVNKKVMAYFSKKYGKEHDGEMPFDTTKMAYGGFKAIVRA